jgi:uncharacterized protein DUF6458
VGIGVSIFLFAIGAILAFAVDAQTRGIDLNAVGVILMIVGAVGVLLSLLFWSSWGGFGSRRETIVESDYGHRDVLEPHHHH